MWLPKLVACYDAAGLRGTQAEWELGREPTVSHVELMKFRLMIRKQNGTLLSQTNVVLLIEYDVLAIMYYELNTFKCVLHISFGYRVICYWSLITGKFYRFKSLYVSRIRMTSAPNETLNGGHLGFILQQNLKSY